MLFSFINSLVEAKSLSCKILANKSLSCKILQEKVDLARSCKKKFILQDLARRNLSCKKKFILQDLANKSLSCKILQEKVYLARFLQIKKTLFQKTKLQKLDIKQFYLFSAKWNKSGVLGRKILCKIAACNIYQFLFLRKLFDKDTLYWHLSV